MSFQISLGVQYSEDSGKSSIFNSSIVVIIESDSLDVDSII
jgi:hypothetical protein